MTRPLVVAAVGGTAVSIVCIALANVVSPSVWPPSFLSAPAGADFDWRRHFRWHSSSASQQSAAIVKREVSWAGAEVLEINLPALVYFQPAQTWHVTVQGTQATIDQVALSGGVLGSRWRAAPDGSSVEVNISGPAVKRFAVLSSAQLVVQQLHQEDLEVDVRGSGSVELSGEVSHLKVQLYGAAYADLRNLQVGNLQASILGASRADIGTVNDAQIAVIGPGAVRLAGRPLHLVTRISGAGRIIASERR